MKWLRKLLSCWLNLHPEPQYVVHDLWRGLDLISWRTSEARVAYARELFKTLQFREMLSVLENGMPVPDISDVTRAGLEAARVRGYLQAIHVLLAMATPVEPDKPELEADYSTPADDLIPTDD